MQQSIPKIILNLSLLPSASVAINLELQQIIQFCKMFQYSEEVFYPEKQKLKFDHFSEFIQYPLPLIGYEMQCFFTSRNFPKCHSKKILIAKVATGKVEQALRPVLNLIFYHFNCSERLLKSHHVFSYQ